MQIILTPKALKHFQALPKNEKSKVEKKIKTLNQNPFSGKKLSGELQELRSLRAWPYRILYYIDNHEKKVYITSILHRQGAYR